MPGILKLFVANQLFKSQVPLVSISVLILCLTPSYSCASLNLSTSSGISFSPNYDMAFPPSPSPVAVSLKTFVQTVSPIQSSEMEFRVNMRWTLSWTDTRITFDPDACPDDTYAILPEDVAAKIWIPDPFIVNAKYSGVKKFDGKLFNLVIYPNSTLSMNFILNATISCAMNFEYYPHDVQNCPMIVQSFAHSRERLELSWDPDHPVPFFIRRSLLIQFMVVPSRVEPFKRSVYIPGLGNVTQLVATFRFQRLVSSYILGSFIPSSLVVVLSWFSFWLELDVTAARGGLLMTCVLSLELHLVGLKSEFPSVAYVKAVDVWLFGCIFLVFMALTEFVGVKVLYSVTEEERRGAQVYTLTKLRLEEGAQYELDNFVPEVTEGLRVTEIEGTSHSPTPNSSRKDPYTAFWLWQELEQASAKMKDFRRPKCQENENEGQITSGEVGPYKKRRLGSVVLSGRSVATSHLPLVQKRCCGLSLPLVWARKGSGRSGEEEGSGRRKVLWREIDNWAKITFPPVFAVFATGYWIVLVTQAELE